MPGFQDLLLRIIDSFDNKRGTNESRKTQPSAGSAHATGFRSGVGDLPYWNMVAVVTATARFCTRWFCKSVKFPMPARLLRLLRHWAYGRRRGDNDRESLDAVMTTLTKIARGGIRSHCWRVVYMPMIRSGWVPAAIRQRADAAAVGRSPYPGDDDLCWHFA